MAIEVRTLGRPERGSELCLSPEESSRIPESVLGYPSSMWTEGAGPFLLGHAPRSRLHQTRAKLGLVLKTVASFALWATCCFDV